ncbi:MAG: VapE family protein [Formivibrio sp.]|nr:VapE family protein [Formivibrio sp.]
MSIDFKAVATAALTQVERFVEEWAPGGMKQGSNWVTKNPVRNENNPSFSISLESGAWIDFASGDAGGDLVSLYSYIFGCNNGEAAHKLAALIGYAIPRSGSSMPDGRITPRAAPAPLGVDAMRETVKQGKVSPWKPIIPVPANAGPYPVAHIKRNRPEKWWEYRDQDGQLIGVIYRFKRSDGGKEILPCVFAEHVESGVREWTWISFPIPRALYTPKPLVAGRKVLLVEGEKCVDAAIELFGDRFNVVTWPGGANAIGKADFSRLADSEVIAWPDCDSLRDKNKTLLPYAKQPGMKAMEKAAEILSAIGCKVRIVDVPQPGEKPEGWDISDAITVDGWDVAACMEFMRANLRLPACASAPPPVVRNVPLGDAGAEPVDDAPAGDAAPLDWSRILYRKANGSFEECRENVFLVLQAHPAWQGVIGYDEFSAKIMKRRKTPFHSPPGEWMQEDDDQLGLWLLQRIGLLVKSTDALVRGVSMVAHKNRFHPLRNYLEGLKWDGVKRNHQWLTHAFAADCSGKDDAERTRRARYLELAGQIFLICMVKIAYEPGSHYCLILEGLQGEGKSKALRALGGEWFCDTPFTRVGDQNSYMAIQGAWLYEIAELDAFNRSDTTAIKAFMTQPVDRYREPYERRMKDRARQTVFSGTTNNQEYLKDDTGNRRFFPVLCAAVNHAWISEWREQLFAEAFHAWRNGALPYPSREDERTYFLPEQQERQIDDPWTEKFYRYLYTDIDGSLLNKVTVYDLLTKAIGMTADKIDGNRSMATRAGKSMARLRWGQGRESSGARERFYTRPREPQVEAQAAATEVVEVQAEEDLDVAL